VFDLIKKHNLDSKNIKLMILLKYFCKNDFFPSNLNDEVENNLNLFLRLNTIEMIFRKKYKLYTLIPSSAIMMKVLSIISVFVDKAN
jgi:hypothetical protein